MVVDATVRPLPANAARPMAAFFPTPAMRPMAAHWFNAYPVSTVRVGGCIYDAMTGELLEIQAGGIHGWRP